MVQPFTSLFSQVSRAKLYLNVAWTIDRFVFKFYTKLTIGVHNVTINSRVRRYFLQVWEKARVIYVRLHYSNERQNPYLKISNVQSTNVRVSTDLRNDLAWTIESFPTNVIDGRETLTNIRVKYGRVKWYLPVPRGRRDRVRRQLFSGNISCVPWQ